MVQPLFEDQETDLHMNASAFELAGMLQQHGLNNNFYLVYPISRRKRDVEHNYHSCPCYSKIILYHQGIDWGTIGSRHDRDPIRILTVDEGCYTEPQTRPAR